MGETHMTGNKRLRTVQIGIGHDHATSGFNSLLRQPECFEVVGFAVPECEMEKYADRIAEYRDDRGIPFYSVEALLNLPNLDCAIIETEEINLTKHAAMAAEKGLHIYMDKPGGTDFTAFEALIQLVREKQLAFSVGYMYRFNPKVLEAMEKIKNGELGEIYCVEAHMDCEHIPEARARLGKFPGGMLFFLGCHLIDLIYRIQGEPEAVLPLSCQTGLDGVEAEDYGMVVYKYPHGVSFAKTCAIEPGGFRRRQLVICGTKGTIEIKPFEILTDVRDMLVTDMRETYPNEGWNSPGKQTTSQPFNRFDPMLHHFWQVAAGLRENEYDYDYELGLFRLLLRSCGVTV